MENQGNTLSINSVLKQIIDEQNLGYGIDKIRVQMAWQKIIGKNNLKYTDEIRLQGKTLFIKLNNAAFRQEMNYKKEEFISLINNDLSKEIINQIVLI